MVIVCEGAIDRHLNPIKPEYIKQVIDKRLGLDTRVTTLGHVQRGGTPCAYDRYLGTMQGVEAVEAVLRSTPDTPSPMIGMSQNKIISVPLMEAVKLVLRKKKSGRGEIIFFLTFLLFYTFLKTQKKKTHAVGDAISKKDFKHAMELRDPDFAASYNAYVESTLMSAMPGSMSKLNEQVVNIKLKSLSSSCCRQTHPIVLNSIFEATSHWYSSHWCSSRWYECCHSYCRATLLESWARPSCHKKWVLRSVKRRGECTHLDRDDGLASKGRL